MAIALYDASVKNYLQTLNAASGFLELGLSHCRSNNIDPESIVDTRVFPDMRPFRFQVQSIALHSAGAIAAIKNGVFQRPSEQPAHDYAGLQALISETHRSLEKLTPAEINGCEENEVIFQPRDVKRVFTAEGFLLSFSLPNFYFHSATAYNILRSQGVPVGKRDYMGAVRLKV